MAAPAQHHDPVAMGPYVWQPLGYQQITTAQFGSAVGLTLPGDNVISALITVEGTPGTDTVRWRDDTKLSTGAAPTSTVGMLLNMGTTPDQPFIYSGDLTAIQFIKAAGSPILNISYYR
jgi:hypothetical protein